MSSGLRVLAVATIVPLAISRPGPAGAPSAGADDVYRSSVEKALERARDELERSLDLYVDHSSWEDPWVVKHGPFEVRSTTSWMFAKTAGRNLDTMLGHFEDLLERPFPRDEVRNVYIFPDLGSYNEFGSPYAHHTSIFGSFYAAEHPERPLATFDAGNPFWTGRFLTHSGLHMYLQRVAPRPLDTWIDEGLASYFTYYFWDYNHAADEYARMLGDGRFIPLRQLLRGELANYTSRPDDWFVELGMFFIWLLHHCEETASPLDEIRPGSFVEYLRKAVRGERLSRHPFGIWLEENLDQIDAEFRAFEFPRY